MEYKKEEKKSAMLLTTHSGMFHMDEVVATAILRLIFPNSKIVRTRDEKKIAEAQIVYDVGKVFDPQANRFDHHQKDFNEYISDNPKIKLSSAGLIYKYFHKQLFSVFGCEETEEHYQDLYKKVYERYFLGVDGIDNGHKREETYYVRPLQDAVRDFNSEDVNNDEKQMENFLKAVKFVTLDLTNYLEKMVDFFKNKLKETTELIKQSDEIIISKKYVSRSTVSEYEKKYGKDIKFIILDSEEGQKRVFTIPISPESTESKVPLNPEWLIDDEQKLREVSGIATINFVHNNLFTGGCGTLEDAKLMCKKSLEAFRKAVKEEKNPSKEEQSFKKKEENK